MGHEARDSLKLVGHTCKILRYKSSSVHSYRENTVVEKKKHFKSLSVNQKNQNSKRIKGFDDGEVNKQFVTKIESLFLEIDVIFFKSDSIFVTDCLLTSPSSKPFTCFEF
jgi:hypothetical protein